MKVTTIALTTLLSANAFADCLRPSWNDTPAIPDGATATREDMLKAREHVVSFVRDGEAYLECSNSEPFVHNLITHTLEKVAARFNRERQHFLDQESAIAAN